MNNTNKAKAKEIVKEVSSTMVDAAFYGAMQMAEWKDKQFSAEKQALIDKACEWLRRNVSDYIAFFGDEVCVERANLIKNLRKSMEE